MSNYTTGEIAQKCSVSVRTVQYYDKQGILSPNQMTASNRRLYTDQEVKKLELIILLKELGCSIKDIKLLLKNDQSLKTLNTMLKVKEDELQEDIKSKELTIKKIKDIRKYFNKTSNSPITHLYDIDLVMKQTSNLKGFRKKMWFSTSVISLIQYTGFITSIVKKDKKPLISIVPITIGYSLLLTYFYKNNVSYLCPNCQNIFNPSIFDFIRAQHTPKTRKLECPKCHQTHFCVEVSKA